MQREREKGGVPEREIHNERSKGDMQANERARERQPESKRGNMQASLSHSLSHTHINLLTRCLCPFLCGCLSLPR